MAEATALPIARRVVGLVRSGAEIGGARAHWEPRPWTEAFAADLRAAGVPVELQWCHGAGHGLVDDVCPDEYATWVRDFFTRALFDD